MCRILSMITIWKIKFTQYIIYTNVHPYLPTAIEPTYLHYVFAVMHFDLKSINHHQFGLVLIQNTYINIYTFAHVALLASRTHFKSPY